MATDVRMGVGAGKCVTDTFTKADSTTSLGTAQTGQAWVLQQTSAQTPPQQASVIGIQTNAAYVPGTGAHTTGPIDLATIDHRFADCRIKVDVTTLPSAGCGAGVIFRYSDSANFWMCFLYFNTVGSAYFLVLRRIVAGAIVGDQEINIAGAGQLNPPVHLEADAVGSAITALVNGNVEATDTSTFNATKTLHGITFYFETNPSRLKNYSGCPAGGLSRKLSSHRRKTHTRVLIGSDV